MLSIVSEVAFSFSLEKNAIPSQTAFAVVDFRSHQFNCDFSVLVANDSKPSFYDFNKRSTAKRQRHQTLNISNLSVYPSLLRQVDFMNVG